MYYTLDDAFRPAVRFSICSVVVAAHQDEAGQVAKTRSISAGLDYPGVGPEHAFLKDSGRAEYVAVTDKQALEAFFEVTA